MPDVLQQVEVYTIDNEDPTCVRTINDIELQFCAGVMEGGKDACQGDSGGPIFQWTGRYWEQVGIVSYGNGCGDRGYPGIYTRLSYYYDWINGILKNEGEHLEPSILTTANTTRTPTTTTSSTPVETITYPCEQNADQCGCSLNNVVLSQQFQAKIVHGHNAVPYSWSMIVSVRVNGLQHTCAGTILSDLFILTAARCVLTVSSPNSIRIIAATHTLSEYPPVIRDVDQMHIHPNFTYEYDRSLHDIAILQLDRPLPLNILMRLTKTCIPNILSSFTQYPDANSSLLIVGWGYSSSGSNFSDVLQQARIKLVSPHPTSCYLYSDNYQFCVGDVTGGTGDLGSPAFIFKQDRWEQVGIASTTDSCDRPGHARVYTRLSVYLPWIKHVTQSNMSITVTSTPLTSLTTTSDGFTNSKNLLTLGVLLLLVIVL